MAFGFGRVILAYSPRCDEDELGEEELGVASFDTADEEPSVSADALGLKL